MARGRRRGSPLWLLSVVAACGVLALLVANAPKHAASVAVRAPAQTTDTTVLTEPTIPVDSTVETSAPTPTTLVRTGSEALTATTPPTTRANARVNRRARAAATDPTTSPDTVAAPPETTPATIAPSLPAPTPVVAHLAVTG
jgi:hypothetical protein